MKCFIDLDGVLVDFAGGVFRATGAPRPKRLGWDFIKPHWWKQFGYDFWKDLSPTEDFKQILSACEAAFGGENCCILTSPCKTPGCVDGKMAWISRHMPQYSRRVLIGAAKHFMARPDAVLVDDYEKNIDEWVDNMGRGVLIPREWNRDFGVPLQRVLDEIGYLSL